METSGSGVLLAPEENPGVLEFSQQWFGFQGGGGCGWPGSLPARTRPPASDRRLEVCTRAAPSHTRRMSGRACRQGLGAIRRHPAACLLTWEPLELRLPRRAPALSRDAGMPFPPGGPTAWHPEEPRHLWAWSFEPGDARAGGQPLPKGMGTGLYPGLRELEGRAKLPPLDLGRCGGQNCGGRCPHWRPRPAGLTSLGACALGLAGWQPLYVSSTPPCPAPSSAGEGFLGGSSLIFGLARHSFLR